MRTCALTNQITDAIGYCKQRGITIKSICLSPSGQDQLLNEHDAHTLTGEPSSFRGYPVQVRSNRHAPDWEFHTEEWSDHMLWLRCYFSAVDLADEREAEAKRNQPPEGLIPLLDQAELEAHPLYGMF